jgi:pilus assembly protein CpaF
MFQHLKNIKPPVPASGAPPPAPPQSIAPPVKTAAPAVQEESPEHKSFLRTDLKVHLHQKLIDLVDLSVLEKMDRAAISQQLAPILRALLDKERIALNTLEYGQLLEELLDEVLGLGPLEPLLKDMTISDILVNTYSNVFIERAGKLERIPIHFNDNAHLTRIIQKIASAVGRRVDESHPWVDARLADGSRVNALLPPCAVDGPLLSIRKFPKIPYTIDLLVANKTLSQDMADVINIIVRMRLNVLISGGTGSGKTTLLNIMSCMISDKERIITIEDTAELQLQKDDLARMESRPPNAEGVGGVTQRDLLKNSLRMRPDRIIVGEVRGAEVLDMLQAMNTGHEGSMTTVHANTPRDALTRLENMVGMTELEIPFKALRSQIASAFHIILQIQRMADGKRKLVSLQEITGMEGDIIAMQEIFHFQRTGVSPEGVVLGHYVATGVRPKFSQRAKEWGLDLPEKLFVNEEVPEK